MKRDFLTLLDYSAEELKKIINDAIVMKKEKKNGIFKRYLENKKVALIFEKSSTRTRVSFEVGVVEMGGYPLFLSKNDIQLGRGESLKDTARTLSRYVNMIMIRTFEHERIEEFAKFSTVPVINGLTNEFHPCQVVADLMTIYELTGKFEGVKLSYIGDGNNMAHSLLIGCAKVGLDISIATPKEYPCLDSVVEQAKKIAIETGSNIEITNDPKLAVKKADFIYTDVWASMGFEDETEKRKNIFKPFQVNKTLIELTGKKTFFMHCLPAHIGEEVTEEVFESEISIVFEQAENRLHAQKGIMKFLMENHK